MFIIYCSHGDLEMSWYPVFWCGAGQVRHFIRTSPFTFGAPYLGLGLLFSFPFHFVFSFTF